MMASAAPLRGPAAAVRTGKATEQLSRAASTPVRAVRRIRKATLRVPAASDGALATKASVAARQVVSDPVPAGIRDLPASGQTGTTTILGRAGGRATTTPVLEATGSGPIGHPSRAPGMGERILPVVVLLASGGVLTVLRD